MDKKYFKAFIRAVKTIDVETRGDDLEHYNIIRENLIIALDKKEVKSILLEKYPQLFQKDKVYEKGTKDNAQFFYVVIFELYSHEVNLVEEGEWVCSQCLSAHKNKYEDPPRTHKRLLDKLFCNDTCMNEHHKKHFDGVILFDGEENHITTNSKNYIYKITEKNTKKSYIGKTKNAPFFRWWNHLTKSGSPFGTYLRSTSLSDWIFEVIKELPSDCESSEVLRVESEFIIKYDCINNGYNTVISNRQSYKTTEQPQLF